MTSEPGLFPSCAPLRAVAFTIRLILLSAALFAAALFFPAAPVEAAALHSLTGSHVPDAVRQSEAVGSMAPSTRMTLAVGLPLRDPAALADLIRDLYDPASASYRRFLTPAEFAARFSPTERDYQAVIDFLRAAGLQVTGTHSNRMIVDVAGSAEQVERAFHLNLMRWRHPARGVFFAPDREPSIDADVSILDISGLDNFVIPHPMSLHPRPVSTSHPLATGSGPGGLFIGGDFRAAYAPKVNLNGSGQAVGLFELDGFFASDVAANFAIAGLPPVPVKTVLLDGFNGAPGSANVEVTLDIMMAAYMAPGLTSVIVYEGLSPNDVLNRMATDDLASQLSSSWGFSPTNASTEQIFKQMIAQGQSLFQASGDDGAYSGGIMPPSDDPNVIVVGGTSLTTSGPGGTWISESAWSGSGGGVSTVWPIPSWQQAVNMAAVGGSNTMRNIPDVALTADIQMFLVCNNGGEYSIGGTSAAAPLWAGFTSLVNQQALSNGQRPVGFLNPALYGIGAASSYTGDLHDIATGYTGFSAMAGYDLTTGWGTPAGQPLINALTGTSNPPAFGLAPSGAGVSVVAGSSATNTITINAQNGFNGSVTLAASGLPAGVTATFSPASAQTTSTLTLTAASSAATGTSTVTITGASGSLTSTARLSLTVTAPPSFTLTAQPATLSVTEGGSGTSAISVTAQNGFSGAVSLAVSGLPSGVTASVAPANTAGSSGVTLTAASSAALGPATVTVTGTSGNLSATAKIALTVTTPAAFTLSASPASLSIAAGATGTSTVSVAPKSGFSGTVSFSASGLPAGVTAAFNPASSTRSSTLTLTVSKTASPGPSTITVTGTSGVSTSQTTIALTVNPAPGFTLSGSPSALTIAAGSSGSSAISIAGQGGFSGMVALSATGLPAGVTASFSPSSNISASTLTLKAASTTVPGNYTVSVNGASGSLTATTTLAVTVTGAPNFTISASPSSLTIPAGSAASSTITLTAQNGFSGTVNVSLSGIPSGVSATWSAGPTGASSILNLQAATTAKAGLSTITVTGTSGSLTNKATIALAITASPGFTLSATPAILSLAPGASVTTAIAVTPLNGFSGTVSMAASGLPTGVTASYSPSATSSSGILTLTAAGTATPASATVTITGTSGSISAKTAVALTVTPPSSFTLTASPASVSMAQGQAGFTLITIVPQNGFAGTPALAVSALPRGVTASFTAGPFPGTSFLTLAAASSVAPGPYTIGVSGSSGVLTASTTINLTVVAPSSIGMPVNLSSYYNVSGMVEDGSTFTGGGLDGGGRAYSANLLGSVQTVNGAAFALGAPPNAPNAVSGGTIPLPAGQFSSLTLLATGVNGLQPNQVFTLTYSDGTTATFKQSLSDWCAPGSYTNESKAVTMGYRDNSTGTRDTRTLFLYGYTFALTSTKTVASIALPNNRNVVVLAMNLSTSTTASQQVQVNLTTAFQTTGITTDGKPFTGGLDGAGYAYSANLLGPAQLIGTTLFNIAASGSANVVSGSGQTIALPAGNFSALKILATAVNGAQAAQTFKVNYSNGTTAGYTQSLSDWLTPQHYAGEAVALAMPYRNASSGAKDARPFQLYQYSFALDPTRGVASVVLPNDANVKVLALTLTP